MARLQTIKFLRTTKANLDTQAAASNLLVGEPYFITDLNMFALGTAVNAYALMPEAFTVATKSTIALDWSEAQYFVCSISGNASLSYTNKRNGVRFSLIKNTSGGSIDVAIPNTSNNVYASVTESIAAGTAKEISAIYDGTNTIWVASKILTVIT